MRKVILYEWPINQICMDCIYNTCILDCRNVQENSSICTFDTSNNDGFYPKNDGSECDRYESDGSLSDDNIVYRSDIDDLEIEEI